MEKLRRRIERDLQFVDKCMLESNISQRSGKSIEPLDASISHGNAPVFSSAPALEPAECMMTGVATAECAVAGAAGAGEGTISDGRLQGIVNNLRGFQVGRRLCVDASWHHVLCVAMQLTNLRQSRVVAGEQHSMPCDMC